VANCELAKESILFGSIVTGVNTSRSDVDIAVLFSTITMDFFRQLKATYGSEILAIHKYFKVVPKGKAAYIRSQWIGISGGLDVIVFFEKEDYDSFCVAVNETIKFDGGETNKEKRIIMFEDRLVKNGFTKNKPCYPV